MDVLIVGLDGLEPTLVRQWRDDLRTLGALVEDGSSGLLHSSSPPLSAPAWPWMFTGKQGGKHGCFGFTTQSSDGYDRRPINFSDIHAESLWEALDEAGVSVGVMNVPFTYPPSDLDNGFVVSGWPVPNRVTVSSPPQVVEEIESELGERYRVSPFPMGPELRESTSEQVVKDITDGIRHHQRAFMTAAQSVDVEVFFCVFMATDIAGHYLAWDSDHLREVYVEMDRALAELLESIQSDPEVILLSDHGHAGQSEWNFHVNEWLDRNGYLERVDRTTSVRRDNWFRSIGITRENLIRLKNAVGIDDVRRLLPQPIFDLATRKIPPADERNSGFDPDRIDWTETTAYSADQNVIYLNTTDEHPDGIVADDESTQVAEQIAAELSDVPHPDPDRSDSLFSDIRLKEEIFDGPFADEAPAIVAIADEMLVPSLMSFNDGEIFSTARSGEHRPTGILVTAGDSFADRETVEDREIVDVFPLILALLDTPIPENVDGTIPTDRLSRDLDPNFRESRDEYGDLSAYSEEESEDIQEQLRGLGYLE